MRGLQDYCDPFLDLWIRQKLEIPVVRQVYVGGELEFFFFNTRIYVLFLFVLMLKISCFVYLLENKDWLFLQLHGWIEF